MTEWIPLLETVDLLRCFQEATAGAVRVRIASAFVSPFAAQRVLEVSEHGPQVTVLVGSTLTTHQIDGLELLRKFCDVRIWTGEASFHPKVYLIETAERIRVIIGSSNFTAGGFSNNVEVNVYADLPLGHSALEAVLERFEQWERNSAVLNDEWVSALRAAAEVAEVAEGLVEEDIQAVRARARIQSLIAAEKSRRESEEAAVRAREAASQPFFRPEHFAAFGPTKQRSEDGLVVQERKAVTQRFLELHAELMPRMLAAGWDLHPHHKDQNITSSWHLVPGIVPQIAAMWLSYGRSRERFKELRDYEADDVQGFFNHTKLQVLIDENTLRFGLMIAQRNNEWDRDYLRKKLGLEKSPVVVAQPDRVIEVLQAAGAAEPTAYLERESHDRNEDRERILLRDLNMDGLLAIVRRDQRGNWLGIWVDYAPTDAAVSEGAILDTTMRVFNHLYPAYDLLASYPRKT